MGRGVRRHVELPPATARKRRDADYPLVPLFVTVDPSEASVALAKPDALSNYDHETFFEAAGRVRGRRPMEAFRVDVARSYVRSAVKWLGQDNYTVAVTALAEPAKTQDFTFDWRDVLDPTSRRMAPGAAPVLVDALQRFRDAVRPTAQFPQLTLDLDLPLPLAMLVGYEWRVTSRLKLAIRQRRRSRTVTVKGDGRTRSSWPTWQEVQHGGSGPCVVAATTTAAPLSNVLALYASSVGASRTMELHAPGELDAPGLRGLARHVAAVLRDVASTGVEKHLLLAGPCALATLVGAGSNANGPTLVPFWNGSGYVSPITIG